MSIITDMYLLKNRRTKIIATLGPSSQESDIIKKLIQAGVNVFRLNMSHGDHDFHRTTFNKIKSISSELNKSIAVLADLCGPKLRTGKFHAGQINLENNSQVTVTTRNIVGEPGIIPSQYGALADDVETGNHILLNDGNLELVVDSVAGTEIVCTVVHGGILKDHKGINLPGVNVSAPSLTEKDKGDAKFALELGVDFLALSFVRCANDIEDLRKLIHDSGHQAAIVAKIEKPEALDEMDGILDATDAIMVARGDLGVELNPEQVPVAQSQLIDFARRKFKPVIVATQMLESMIENARPTRAEVTDISYAVSLGTDAVMLSAESAAGAFPVESVEMMDRIIRQTEAYLWNINAYDIGIKSTLQPPIPIWEAVANATNDLTKDIMARAVIVISQSGMSAITMSSARPAAPIVAVTSDERVCRKMALMWSIIPVFETDAGNINPNQLARRVARDNNLAEAGQLILVVRGFHSDPMKNTPSITVLTV